MSGPEGSSDSRSRTPPATGYQIDSGPNHPVSRGMVAGFPPQPAKIGPPANPGQPPTPNSKPNSIRWSTMRPPLPPGLTATRNDPSNHLHQIRRAPPPEKYYSTSPGTINHAAPPRATAGRTCASTSRCAASGANDLSTSCYTKPCTPAVCGPSPSSFEVGARSGVRPLFTTSCYQCESRTIPWRRLRRLRRSRRLRRLRRSRRLRQLRRSRRLRRLRRSRRLRRLRRSRRLRRRRSRAVRA